MGAGRSATLDAEPRPASVIRAAGGIVVRRSRENWSELAIVHRPPPRADWSFPKGKLEPGESFEACALREVYEETGLRCRLGRFVGHTEYRDRKDRYKVVAYWVMEAAKGTFRPNQEVDELRWARIGEAEQLLSYERDRQLLIVLAAADEIAPLAG